MADPPALSIQHLDPNRCPDQPLITWARGEEDSFTLSLSEVKKVCHTQGKFLSLCTPSHPQHLTLFDTIRDYLLLRRLEQPYPDSGEPDIIMEAFAQSILVPGIGKLERSLGCAAQTAWQLSNPLKISERRALTKGELEAFAFHALRGLHKLAVTEPNRNAEIFLAVAKLYKQLNQRGMPYALLSEWQQESLQVFASLFASYPTKPAKGWQSIETLTDLQTFKSTPQSCQITTISRRAGHLLSPGEKDAAIEFLGSLVIPGVRNELVGLLGKEKDPRRREQIIQAIGHLGRQGFGDEGLKALEDTLERVIRDQGEASQVRGAAIVSLALITRQPMKAIVEPFLDPSIYSPKDQTKKPIETLPTLVSLQIPALTALYYEGTEDSLGLMNKFYDDLLSDEAKRRTTHFLFRTGPRVVKLPLPNGATMTHRVTARSDGPLDSQVTSLHHPAVFAYFTNRLGNSRLPKEERRYAALILLLQGHRDGRTAQWVADLLLDNQDTEAAALLREQLKELPASVTVTGEEVTNRDRLKISPPLNIRNAHPTTPPIPLKMEWRGEKDPLSNLQGILRANLDHDNFLLVIEVPEAGFSDQTGKSIHEHIKGQMAQIIDPVDGVGPEEVATRITPHSIRVLLYETPSEQWRVGVRADENVGVTGEIDLNQFEWQQGD